MSHFVFYPCGSLLLGQVKLIIMQLIIKLEHKESGSNLLSLLDCASRALFVPKASEQTSVVCPPFVIVLHKMYFSLNNATFCEKVRYSSSTNYCGATVWTFSVHRLKDFVVVVVNITWDYTHDMGTDRRTTIYSSTTVRGYGGPGRVWKFQNAFRHVQFSSVVSQTINKPS